MTTDERLLHILTLSSKPWTIDHLRMLGKIPRREIEAAVERLRVLGNPIIAGNNGLRLTNDPAELREYVEARRRRLRSQYRGTRALKRTLRAMEDQAASVQGLTLWSVAS